MRLAGHRRGSDAPAPRGGWTEQHNRQATLTRCRCAQAYEYQYRNQKKLPEFDKEIAALHESCPGRIVIVTQQTVYVCNCPCHKAKIAVAAGAGADQ